MSQSRSPEAPGTIVVVEPSGQRRSLAVAPGERVLVGSDLAATIQVVHPRVVPQQASIERSGPGWLVNSLDPANPIWMLDETGRAIPVMEEIGLRSATLLSGATQLLLHPPAA